jgi:hypothetical protein
MGKSILQAPGLRERFYYDSIVFDLAALAHHPCFGVSQIG